MLPSAGRVSGGSLGTGNAGWTGPVGNHQDALRACWAAPVSFTQFSGNRGRGAGVCTLWGAGMWEEPAAGPIWWLCPPAPPAPPACLAPGGAQWRGSGRGEYFVRERDFREVVHASFVLITCVEQGAEWPSDSYPFGTDEAKRGVATCPRSHS